MHDWRPIVHQHNIGILYSGFKKCYGNARTMELECAECADIHHLETGFKSDEWHDGLILDVRKAKVYAILFKENLNPVSCQRRRDNERTGQDSLQQAQIKNRIPPWYEREWFRRKHYW
jgi:hypothetical protein